MNDLVVVAAVSVLLFWQYSWQRRQQLLLLFWRSNYNSKKNNSCNSNSTTIIEERERRRSRQGHRWERRRGNYQRSKNNNNHHRRIQIEPNQFSAEFYQSLSQHHHPNIHHRYKLVKDTTISTLNSFYSIPYCNCCGSGNGVECVWWKDNNKQCHQLYHWMIFFVMST